MVSTPTDLPAQPSLRRLRQFGVRPNRELGQNFLVDSNLLDVIGRLAELDERDVVLEVGGGLGVPTARWSRPCATRSIRSPTRRCTSPMRPSSTCGH